MLALAEAATGWLAIAISNPEAKLLHVSCLANHQSR